jgi:hypothetical protein
VGVHSRPIKGSEYAMPGVVFEKKGFCHAMVERNPAPVFRKAEGVAVLVTLSWRNRDARP